MGEQNITHEHDERRTQAFMKALLADLSALRQMLETGCIESGVRRIGAEQEMFLVDPLLRPAPVAMEVLRDAAEPRLTTEIGRFNLEANLSPRLFTGQCLSDMERETRELVEKARAAAVRHNADILLAGILPTISRHDLTEDNLTPMPRYQEMNRMMRRLRGGIFNAHIKGLDELYITHDNIMLEACCTSFQMHMQTGPAEFAGLYNLAQLITAPVLAAAVNSPLLLGQRLWQETRIPLFQHSVDERSGARLLRSHPARVSFGEAWIRDSAVEIFQEEIARFRVILTREIEEDALATLARGELPRLDALRLHNGTVWRWNRPCYGVGEGRAHLRIEMRAIPAGPTIADEIANAAFFYGLMSALPAELGDVSQLLPFDDVRGNFLAAARQGLQAQLSWPGTGQIPATTLILDRLLPLAQQGLTQAGLDAADTERFLDIVRQRVRSRQTGAQWALRSLAAMESAAGSRGTPQQRFQALAASMLQQQKTGAPVHLWEPAALPETAREPLRYQVVSQLMSTDLFTVRPDDLVDLAASLMQWKHVRHVPVEDEAGKLVGIVSHRDLLDVLVRYLRTSAVVPVTVREIMKSDPVTIAPTATTAEAAALMRRHRISCLPVLESGKLSGILTAQDIFALAADILNPGPPGTNAIDDRG
ncbi:MAG: CBS domain-containing protein [Blastocatellia bacterium]